VFEDLPSRQVRGVNLRYLIDAIDFCDTVYVNVYGCRADALAPLVFVPNRATSPKDADRAMLVMPVRILNSGP
jgi:hypothetical protein